MTLRWIAVVLTTTTFSACVAFNPGPAGGGRFGQLHQAEEKSSPEEFMDAFGDGMRGFGQGMEAMYLTAGVLLLSGLVVGLVFLVKGSKDAADSRPSPMAVFDPRCEQASASGCYALGARHRDVIEAACLEGLAEACADLCALGDARGCGASTDPGVLILEDRCERGRPDACYQLGRRYRHGQGVPRDRERARAYFELACEQRYENACLLMTR